MTIVKALVLLTHVRTAVCGTESLTLKQPSVRCELVKVTHQWDYVLQAMRQRSGFFRIAVNVCI